MMRKNRLLCCLLLSVTSFFVWIYVYANSFVENLASMWVDIVSLSNKSSISRYEMARLLNASNCEDCVQEPYWMKQTYSYEFWENFRKLDWKYFADINFNSAIWNNKSYYYCVAYVWENGYMAWYPLTSTKCKWNFCGQDSVTVSEFYEIILKIRLGKNILLIGEKWNHGWVV